MISKIIKLLRLIRSVNVRQTLMMRKRFKHPKSASLHVCNHSLIHIDNEARIELSEKHILTLML